MKLIDGSIFTWPRVWWICLLDCSSRLIDVEGGGGDNLN